jgi:hypothetical protein
MFYPCSVGEEEASISFFLLSDCLSRRGGNPLIQKNECRSVGRELPRMYNGTLADLGLPRQSIRANVGLNFSAQAARF